MAFLLPWHSTTRNKVGPGDTEDDGRKAQTGGFFSFIVFSVESSFLGYDRFAHFPLLVREAFVPIGDDGRQQPTII
jgi:hypothetical protein